MIYFVLCPPFHGATLLSLLLNNHSKVLSLGDTNPTREYDQTCACGQKVSKCEFWEHIREETDWSEDDPIPNMMQSYPMIVPHEGLNKAINTAFALTAQELGAFVWKLIKVPADNFKHDYQDFQEACQSWVEHDVFVDGEKSLLKFISAASMEFPVKGVIHLTRDPRAYVASCRKNKQEEMEVDQLALDWMIQHRRIGKYTQIFSDIPVLRLKYEDLTAKPQESMDKVFGFMGLETEKVVSEPKNPDKHHMLGPKMLREFDGTIKQDKSWEDSLSAGDLGLIRQRVRLFSLQLGYEM